MTIPNQTSDEIMKLRQENLRLKRQLDPKVSTNKKSRHVIKKSFVVLLVSAVVALLTAANLLFWTGNTIVKQDRFVTATQPIIKDPAVQDSLALYATNSIFNNIDVQSTVQSALPPKADFLAPQLTSQAKTFTQNTFDKVLATPKFQDKWNQIIANQHQRLINFASRYEGDGTLSLNDVYTNLATSLQGTNLAFLADKQLPPNVGNINVIKAAWLPAFHNLVTKIDTWRLLALGVLAVCVAGAAWLSANKRRTLYIFSAASVIMMAGTLLALNIAIGRVVDKVDPQYSLGAQNALNIFFNTLVIQTITVGLAAAFVGLIAWVSGPARRAVAIRQKVISLFGRRIHGRLFGAGYGWTAWVQEHNSLLMWVTVAVVSTVMLLVGLTPWVLVGYTALMILIVLLIEIIGGNKPTAIRL